MSQEVRVAQDVVMEALYLTRVYTPSQPPNQGAVQRGLNLLNYILDSYSQNGVLIPLINDITFELIPGKRTYSFSKTVPADVEQEMIVQALNCDIWWQDFQYPVEIKAQEQIDFHYIYNKAQSMPCYVTLNSQALSSSLSFYPIPDKAYECKLRYKSIIPSLQLNQDLTNVPNSSQLLLIYKLGSVLSDFYSNAVWNEKKQDELNKLEAAAKASSPRIRTSRPSNDLRRRGRGWQRSIFYSGWY